MSARTRGTCTWDPGQVKMFARQIADSPEGKAWWAFPAEIREAIISHRVLMIVLSVRGQEAIEVDDVRELRILIAERLAAHHNLRISS